MERERIRATMTNSTPWAVKHPMNSSKSGARSMELPPQEFDRRQAFRRRPRQPVAPRAGAPFLVGEQHEMHDALNDWRTSTQSGYPRMRSVRLAPRAARRRGPACRPRCPGSTRRAIGSSVAGLPRRRRSRNEMAVLEVHPRTRCAWEDGTPGPARCGRRPRARTPARRSHIRSTCNSASRRHSSKQDAGGR